MDRMQKAEKPMMQFLNRLRPFALLVLRLGIGIIFLTHRIHIHNTRPLFVEIEELPTELP